MDRQTPPDGGTPLTQGTGSHGGSDGLLEGLPPEIRRAIIQPRDPAPPPEAARGVPAYVGRPPSYPPRPLGLPSVHDGDPLAAVLPDSVVDGAELGPLTVRAASVRGDSHRWRGECRQDALGVTRLGPAAAGGGAGPQDFAGSDGLLLLAVADGVGSAPLSHRGAHAVVACAARQLDGAAAEWAAALRTGDGARFQALADEAVAAAAAELRASIDAPATAYATTFRALVVPLDPAVRVRGFLGVGDGGLFRLRDRGWWNLDHPATAAAGSGVIDTRTAALPDAYQQVSARLLEPSEPGDVLVLCTDGFSGPLAGEKEFREHVAEQWGHTAGVPQPSDFLWHAQTRLKSYDDDRTIICLWEGIG
ncbi:protein phosphatase 2C domain-containing protein [Streptomyces sp. B8F3]|uniref:protein phosphatase 2C domain-containing protein n=1 Tax=unclassified Streptomyces TaxID=2593676 RepID=UPI00325D37E5